jgi:glutamyl-tRNA synthetase
MVPVTRFAPSPTGLLHAGNARTALYNWLLARGGGGRFLLRIEDTDVARSEERHLESLLTDLAWLGLDWDGGPDRPAAGGPFRQSERLEVYREQLGRLAEAGRAFACWRTEEELKAHRAEQRRRKLPPRYDREWARLPADEVARRRENGQQPVMRFRVPDRGDVAWDDLLRGARAVPCERFGDFVVARAGGRPGFLFANAVDDALMGVTHVLRGEDHLENTARQILLLQALGLPQPRYGHLPLLAGEDGAKLSKRTGARSLGELRGDGILPLALANYLVQLGDPDAPDRLRTVAEMAAEFEPSRLSKATPRFDLARLAHWQRLAIDASPVCELAAWAGEKALAPVPVDAREAFLEAVRPNVARPGDVADWVRIVFGAVMLAESPVPDADPVLFAAARDAFANQGPDVKAMAAAAREAAGVRGRAFYRPLRLALTGREDGPELAALLPLIPAATLRARLEAFAARKEEPPCSSSTTP